MRVKVMRQCVARFGKEVDQIGRTARKALWGDQGEAGGAEECHGRTLSSPVGRPRRDLPYPRVLDDFPLLLSLSEAGGQVVVAGGREPDDVPATAVANGVYPGFLDREA